MTTASLAREPLARHFARRLDEANPVLVKELRSRFRGARAFGVLSAYLGLLVLVVWSRLGSASYGALPQEPATLGRALMRDVGHFLVLSVLLLGPLLTAWSISGERQRGSLDLLITTPLRGDDIARGKVLAGMAFILLLILSTLPVLSLGFVLGGVSALDLLLIVTQAALIGAVMTALGVFASARAKRDHEAIMTCLMCFVGSGFGILLMAPFVGVLWWMLVGMMYALTSLFTRWAFETWFFWNGLFSLVGMLGLTTRFVDRCVEDAADAMSIWNRPAWSKGSVALQLSMFWVLNLLLMASYLW